MFSIFIFSHNYPRDFYLKHLTHLSPDRIRATNNSRLYDCVVFNQSAFYLKWTNTVTANVSVIRQLVFTVCKLKSNYLI